MFKGFQKFLLRGNIVDLAVAVVIGGAFGDIVKSLTAGLITPLIGAVGGTPDFSNLKFTINGSEFLIGIFLNALISFIIISAVIYFLIVIPMNKFMERLSKGENPIPTEKNCPECLSSIPLKATRCKYCASPVK